MNSELVRYLRRQSRWSLETFGEGPHTAGIIAHIRKELKEVKVSPFDLEEWIDVLILAFDGYMRHGGRPAELMARLQAKQDKNFARRWPFPQPGQLVIEHIREE